MEEDRIISKANEMIKALKILKSAKIALIKASNARLKESPFNTTKRRLASADAKLATNAEYYNLCLSKCLELGINI